jgi:hypothetical protein
MRKLRQEGPRMQLSIPCPYITTFGVLFSIAHHTTTLRCLTLIDLRGRMYRLTNTHIVRL